LATEPSWSNLTAGQRAQIVKPGPLGKGELQFGTEVVTSAHGTLAGVLGASPGASTAVSIALDVLQQCFPARLEHWARAVLPAYLPSIGLDLLRDEQATARTKARIRETLNVH